MDGGKRGPGDVVWSWDVLCFDHSMIYLSAYIMGLGGCSYGGVGLCFYLSMIHLSACNMGWARGVVMVVGDAISQCFNFLLVLWVGVR